MPHLFLDCDGVLADFDAGALKVLGMSVSRFEQRHGKREFWRRLARTKDFYATLPEIPDARELFDAVKHLKPTILTGLPLGNWAAPQKVRWAAEHFPGVPIITCMARDKYRHMSPGDVLVDDREDHRARSGKTRAGCSSTTKQHGRASKSSPACFRQWQFRLKPRRRRPPSLPTRARKPARGSTSPARSRRSR